LSMQKRIACPESGFIPWRQRNSYVSMLYTLIVCYQYDQEEVSWL
jgi:hypothetical protein